MPIGIPNSKHCSPFTKSNYIKELQYKTPRGRILLKKVEMRWCILASLLVLAEAAWEFGLDSPDLELLGVTKGKIKVFQKITRVDIRAPQCYEINYVLVEVSNLLSTPDVSYNKNTQVVTIKYKLLQMSYSSYYITVKGRRKQFCETLYPGGVGNGNPLYQNIPNVPLQNNVYQNGGFLSLRGMSAEPSDYDAYVLGGRPPKHILSIYKSKRIPYAMYNPKFPYYSEPAKVIHGLKYKNFNPQLKLRLRGSGIIKKNHQNKKRPKKDLQLKSPFKILDTIDKYTKPPSSKRTPRRILKILNLPPIDDRFIPKWTSNNPDEDPLINEPIRNPSIFRPGKERPHDRVGETDYESLIES